MLSHTLVESAYRVLDVMFIGGMTREDAEKHRVADTPEWNQAVRYARAAVRGIVPDSVL